MMKILLFISILVLTGCASLTAPARLHELEAGKNYWFDYDVTRRGTVLVGSSKAFNTCSEPAPDAAVGLVAKLEGNLKAAGQGEASVKSELTQDIVNLAERTQMVLFLRESMYRLCELSMNKELTPQDSKELYTGVINAALTLVQKDKVQAELNLEIKRQASANEAKRVFEFLNERNVDPAVIQDLLQTY